MMAVAASMTAAGSGQATAGSSKPHANCLKPKEMRKGPAAQPFLRRERSRQARLHHDPRFETKAVELPEDHGNESDYGCAC
jgi:hypothetical protein